MDDYLDALLTQLRLAAPPAVAMLGGDETDPMVLAVAVEAASLLDGQPWLSADDQALAEQVLTAARRARPDLAPDAETLRDLLAPERIAAPEERWLDRVVHLAAISSVLPPAARDRVEVFLDEARARTFTRPDLVATCATEAAVLRDALDLPDHHPVAGLLVDIAESGELAAAPAPTEALSAAVARARRDLGLTGLAAVVRALETHFDAAARWLDAQLAAPAPALAADDDVRPPPERLLLSRSPAGELCLVVHDGAVLLEWASEDGPLPRRLDLNGAPLDPAPPLLDGTACWFLRATGSTADRFTVHLDGGQTLDITAGPAT